MLRILDDRPELWPYILASVILHALLFAFLPRAILPAAHVDEKPIEVVAIDELPQQGKAPMRIADIPKPAVEQRPTDAKFLGLYDSTVSQEQVGVDRRPGEGGQGAKFKTRIGGEVAKRRPARAPSEAAKPARDKQPDRRASSDRLFAFNKSLFDDKAPEEQKAAAPERGGEAAGSAGAMDDFYPDFRRGAHTYLNVLRYPGVEYFVRMKRAFKIAFNPEPSLREHFSRNIVSRGSVDVVLGVSVAPDGRLAELFVFRSSGIHAYDEEALRTVRVSAPFSSPPDKFLAGDGLLRMSWTFSVYL